MAELFKRSAFVFLENDSRDGTKLAIQRWCEGRRDAHLLSLDGLAAAAPVRTIRLATARNRLVAAVRRDYHRFDYLFVLDCDEINTPSLDLEAVKSALRFLQEGSDRAAVFANQPRIHSDLWAFRHPLLCPGDVWEEVFDYAAANRVTDEEAFAQTFSKRMFSLPATEPPLEVESAFGGFGIYKMQSVLNNQRAYAGYKRKAVTAEAAEWLRIAAAEIGWQSCEHVSFHAGLRELGLRLFVLPGLLNDEGPVTFRPSAWRRMIFDQRLVPAAGSSFQGPGDWGKVGRNQACPCGSGKRYKLCHGAHA
ncbi:MAG TPA: SEC-C metal-binding domain-containing protein [Xanthobacteraceae bacterium]|nr:SEC-C metal-binding domain-containing protein [Xanthobacteraceae bacterium]